ncbi:MAG: 2-succinyl-5-enolpyruvyl-6-hydroxy-3-cyclohexene-1-carboxylic-acid synthase, partial [Lentisphaerae bacterium]
MSQHAPSQQAAIAQTLIHTCTRFQVVNFFVSPGSRSTPLLLAALSHPQVRLHRIVDERGAAYAALNFARASSQPVAVITTSGTAAGNLMPAVMEADRAGIPLLLLTADRPPELLGVGANQTTRQKDLFLNLVRASWQLPTGNHETPALNEIARQLSECLVKLDHPLPGPVHINCPFREPFFLEAIDPPRITIPLRDAPEEPDLPDAILARVRSAKRPLITLGRIETVKEQSLLAPILQHLRLPIYTDIGSGFRLTQFPSHVSGLELIIQSTKFCPQPPDFVLHIGSYTVSKHYWQWLTSQSQTPQICQLSFRGESVNPMLIPTHYHDRLRPEQIASILQECTKLPANDWLTSTIPHTMSDMMENVSPPWLPPLMQQLPCPASFFFGNSSVPRYFQLFALPSQPQPVPVAINRGVSGIDGNLHSLLGWTLGNELPAIAVMGDLTFYHDLNALPFLSKLPFPLLIIVLNNAGGSIFYNLPIASHSEICDYWFACRDAVELPIPDLARTFNFQYHCIE